MPTSNFRQKHNWDGLVPMLLVLVSVLLTIMLGAGAWFAQYTIPKLESLGNGQTAMLIAISTDNEFKLQQTAINSENEKRFTKLETNLATVVAKIDIHQRYDDEHYIKKTSNLRASVPDAQKEKK